MEAPASCQATRARPAELLLPLHAAETRLVVLLQRPAGSKPWKRPAAGAAMAPDRSPLAGTRWGVVPVGRAPDCAAAAGAAAATAGAATPDTARSACWHGGDRLAAWLCRQASAAEPPLGTPAHCEPKSPLQAWRMALF